MTLAEESVRSRAWEAKAREYLGLAADTAHRVGAALDAQSEAHAEALQAELHNQELEMAVEYTEAANAERIGRSEALDSVRRPRLPACPWDTRCCGTGRTVRLLAHCATAGALRDWWRRTSSMTSLTGGDRLES